MSESNWANRTLFHGDNLAFLRAMNSESVDLIATVPPFNKGRDFHSTPDSLAAGAKFQDRWSWARDVHQEWIDQITDDYPRLMEAIDTAQYAHSEGMGATCASWPCDCSPCAAYSSLRGLFTSIATPPHRTT